MDNDDISQNVNHLNYAGVGLPGATGITASSSFRTNTHGSNVGGESPDGKNALSALHYQWKGMVPQYPAEYKSLNGHHFQNGSALTLERKNESGDHFNPSSMMSSRQGQFNSLPPKAVNNNGLYFNGVHTKTTSNADGEADDLPPDGVPHNLEQMRLLHKFKELRRHQMQQQEMLMQQQEQQLALLRQEMKQRHRQVTNLQPPHIDISKEKQYQKLGMQTPPIKQSHRNLDEITSVQQIPNDSQQTVFYQLQEDDDLSSLEGDDPKDPSHLSPYPDLDGISRLEDDYLSESEAKSAYVEGKEFNHFNGQGALSPRRMGQSKGSSTKGKLSRSNRNASPDGDVTEKQQLTSSASENTHLSKSNPLDERPISSKLGRKKTFEELVEEQLKEEKENQSNSSTNVVVKRPFLRRGEGIARFHPPPDEKSIQRMKKGPRSVSSVPPAIVPPKEINRRPLSQPILSTKKTNKAVKLSVKPPKYPSSRQKLKLGGSLKPAPSVTPAPSEDPSKSVPLTSSSSSQSDQYATSFSSVSNAVPTTSKEVERILRAIYDGEPVCENGELSDPDSKKAERNSPTDSIEIEKTDLAEFEYMEQMADDMSFCSDTSVVIKFMDKRLPVQKSDSSESRMSSQIQRRDFVNHFEESRPTSAKLSPSASQQSQNSPKSASIDSDDSLANSSDADTLTGSPEKVADNELCMNERESVLEYEDSDVDDKAIQNQIDHLFENTSLARRKSEQKDSVKLSRKVTVASQFDFEAMKGSDVVFPPPGHQPKVLTRKIAQKENRSKQKTVPDVDSLGSSSSLETFDHSRYEESPERTTNSDIHSSDECFTDDGTVENSTPNTSRSSSVIDEFDDYDEWNDTCDSVLKNSQHFITNGSSATEDNAAENLGKFITSDKKAVSSIASPPTSKLVSKLFPVLKSKPTNEDKSEEARQCKLQAVTQVPVGDGLQSKLLREKLGQLEKEIARFRKENATLEKLHREREEGVKKLRKDMSEFEAAKKEELEKLYEFKEEEMKKLRNERKVFEKYHKAVRSLPNKEQRQEIEMLKTQLSDFQEEMRRKESRWNSNTNRLRQRIQDLEDENKQLKEEVNFMENKRLEWLQEKESLLQTQKKLHQKNSRSQIKTSATPNSINSDQESDVGQKERKVHQMFLASPAGDYRFVGGGKKKEQFEPGKVVRTSSEAVPRQPSAMLATPQEMNNGNDEIRMELNRMPERRKKPPILKHSPIIKGDVIEEVQHSDGKIERRYQSGSREVVFSNGTRKEMSADGRDIILWFFNGDIKQITEDQTVVYFYAESQTTVTTYPGGLEVLEFPKGQIEKHYPDGTQEITFPDQTVKYLRPDGSEESHCQDGTIIKVDANRVRTLEFPNGQKEIHTEKFKRREYPDGTQKTIYPDGRQETKFSNGRIRIKDKDGNILLDKKF